ncbi:MAG: response regulator [Pyrinomonadaceae bacterium]
MESQFNSNMGSGSNQTQISAALASSAARGAILLVEDDKVLRRYLEVLLRRAGYTVLAAADGLEAIKIAFSSNIAGVVTDAIMPRLGGHELCRILRSRAELAHVPIVMLSGVVRDDAATDCRTPADAQLTKPVRADELIDCLDRLLARAA